MWTFNSTFSFLISSFGYFYGSQEDIVVNTTYGSVRGIMSESRNGIQFYEFLGIPYAKPPVGDLRFQAPQAPDSWEGIRDGTKYGNQCLQVDMIAKIAYGDEDCLFLNVFTHSYDKGEDTEDTNSTGIPQKELNPVIIFIHGGVFMFGGSNMYRPKYFMDKDVVLITINYRLGSFDKKYIAGSGFSFHETIVAYKGFLNMGTDDIQGNMGLKDQVMAMKWVQDNVVYFGGDPTKVTIMGESAGGASVHLHTLSPMSKGLFQQAISLSGTFFSYWAFKTQPLEQAKRFVGVLNCESEDMQEVSRCLRNTSSEEIIISHLECAYFFHHPHALYAPTIETAGKDLFLSEHPEEIIKSGKVASAVPWITGVNSEEGLIFVAPILTNETVRDALNANWTKWLPILFHFDEEPHKVEIANKIREYYLGSVDTDISMENLANFTAFVSDRAFYQGLHYTSLLYGTFTNATIYPYMYSYKGVFSVAQLFFDLTNAVPPAADLVVTVGWRWLSNNIFGVEKHQYGACHGDELFVMFDMPLQPIHKRGSSLGLDYEISENLVKIWTDFAKNGYPPQISNISWPVLNITSGTKNVLRMMEMSNEFTTIEEPYSQRADFWQSLNMSDVTTKVFII